MKLYTKYIVLLLSLISAEQMFAQCANNNTFFLNITPPPGAGQTSQSTCTFAGEYNIINVICGETYTIATCAETPEYDTQLTLINEATGLVVGYNDDGCAPLSTITYAASFTGVLRVLLDEYNCISNSTCTTMDVTRVSVNTPPTNDECFSATAITAGQSACTAPATTTNIATCDSGMASPGCASYSGGDVWHSVIVPCSGTLTVETGSVAGSPVTDTGLALYSGYCSTLALIECDDDDSPNGLFSLISLTGLTPDAIIYIRTWEFGNDAFGEYTVCAWETTPLAPPANDNCATATPLTVAANQAACTPTNGTNAGATDSGITLSCGNYQGDDVWYSVVVPNLS